jgi:SAM-dependent methyltransferase
MPSAPATGYSFHGTLLSRIARRLFLPQPAAAPAREEHQWQRYWGESYGPDLKQWLLKPVFEELDAAGKIGSVVVDAGSGAAPVTKFLPARAGRRRILVDIAADNARSADAQKIRLDAEKVGDLAALSFRKGLLRVCRFLGKDPRKEGNGGADMMVFSDLLNYVDFRKVLREFSRYLNPGGRLVVCNLPMRGNQELFSEKGLKDNRHLYQFLEEHQFEIEHKSFPKRPRGETEEAEELIVLVARKCG